MLGLLGFKKGMTHVFDNDGDMTPVTVVEVGPCTVVQKKTKDTDGYAALQLGIKKTKPVRKTKPYRGHFEKKGLAVFTYLKEYRTDGVDAFNVGEELFATAFKAGDIVCVSGVTKGRGFQGVIKRHGKHGGPAAHGSDFHRRPGSIGMRTWPGRVPKNMKLPGHMGVDNVTIKNLEVVMVRPDENLVLIKGSLPGPNGALVEIIPVSESIEKRPELKGKKTVVDEPKQDSAEEPKA